MEEIFIEIPKELGNTYESYVFFLAMSAKLKEIKSSKIILDFKKTRWFRANLTSVLGAICIDAIKNNDNKVVFRNLTKSIKKILRKNHFSKKIGIETLTDTYKTTIKYKEFNPKESDNFQKYLKYEMVPSLNVKMSTEFNKEFRQAVEELFQNSRFHGDCDKIYTCGQYFPSENHVYFTIVNLGTTIEENVARKLNIDDFIASKSIEWATKNGNTTKNKNQAGGLGFPFLINFLSKNHGEIQIISSNGFYEKSDNGITLKTFENKFLGTIVNLVFRINDKKSYKIDTEEKNGILNIENIF